MKAMTTDCFNSLSAFWRGFHVYMKGTRSDQPNVPDEKNPFPSGSNHEGWEKGQLEAILIVQDNP